MSTLFLHIGTPKTGTSSIQFFLSKNHTALKKFGFCYPDFSFRFPGITPARNGHFLVQKDSSKKGMQQVCDNKYWEQGFDKVISILNQNQNVVLSDEGIWNAFHNFEDFWPALQQKITTSNHELKVIVYVRRQDDLVQSYWAQQVKETSTLPFQKYLKKGSWKKFHMFYYDELNAIAAVIGKENLLVRPYEKNQFLNQNLIEDFLALLQIPLDSNFSYPDPQVNTSISGEYLEVKRILNKEATFAQKGNYMIPLLIDLSLEHPPKMKLEQLTRFTHAQKMEFLAQFEEQNQKLAKEYLQHADGILFYNEISKASDEELSYATDDLVLACGTIIQKLHTELENTPKYRLKKFAKKILKR